MSESQTSFPQHRALSLSATIFFSGATVMKSRFFFSVKTSGREKSTSPVTVRKQ